MNESFLLDCPNYKAYLDRFITEADMRYLRNIPVARMLVQLNYRINTKIYTKEEFMRHKRQVYELYNPEIRKALMFSWGIKTMDPVLMELAEREKPNQQKTLSTIIHLRYYNKNGFEISGFIDYADSLRQSNLQIKNAVNWAAVFEERAILRPKHTDLSYYDWHMSRVYFNDTENYVVLHDAKGLIFMHRGDHKKLCVDKKKESNLNGYTRAVLSSKVYGYVVLYDHIIRKKI